MCCLGSTEKSGKRGVGKNEKNGQARKTPADSLAEKRREEKSKAKFSEECSEDDSESSAGSSDEEDSNS